MVFPQRNTVNGLATATPSREKMKKGAQQAVRGKIFGPVGAHATGTAQEAQKRVSFFLCDQLPLSRSGFTHQQIESNRIKPTQNLT